MINQSELVAAKAQIVKQIARLQETLAAIDLLMEAMGGAPAPVNKRTRRRLPRPHLGVQAEVLKVVESSPMPKRIDAIVRGMPPEFRSNGRTQREVYRAVSNAVSTLARHKKVRCLARGLYASKGGK